MDAARSVRRENGVDGSTIDADCIDSLSRVVLLALAERHAAAARRIMRFAERGRERERARSEESEIRRKLRL